MSGVVLVHGLLLVFALQPHEAAKSDAARGPLLVARAIWCVLGREIRQHRELQHLVQTISHRLVGRLDGGRRVEIQALCGPMLHRAAANCRLHYAKATVMGMRRDFEQAACHDLHEADLWAGTALTNAVACTAWHWLSWHAKGLLMLFDTISPPAFAPRSGVGLKAKAPHVALLPAGTRIDCRMQRRTPVLYSHQAEAEHIGLAREQKRWEAMRGRAGRHAE